MDEKKNRIPSLDGARAVSILLVVLFHIETQHPLPLVWRVNFGNLGVRVFFVISGFIITTLLLREHERTGAVSLGGFYMRRAFRILPAYYAFLGAAILLSSFGGLKAGVDDFISAFFYFSNYKLPLLQLGHTWSLSVEEQFYLLWPATIVLLGLPRARNACLLILLAAPGFRVLVDLGLWHVAQENFAFECVCDALAVGCLLAILRERLWAIELYRRAIESKYVILVPAGALLFMAFQPPLIVRDVIGLPALNVGIAMVLDRYMRFPGTRIAGRFLNSEPMVWIGLISYSLYLWHPLLVYSDLPMGVRVVGSFACAAVSYYAIERPMLKARARIASAFSRRTAAPVAMPQ